MAAPYSMDLRERVANAWDDSGDADEIAATFQVSRAWVHRLIQRRRETGTIAPRKPTKFRSRVLAGQEQRLAALQTDRSILDSVRQDVAELQAGLGVKDRSRLGEYLNTVTVAAIAVTLFLGGWRGPHPGFALWLWPLLWFLLKLVLVIYVYIWIRATVPRLRYDRLMAFGWKVLIPFGLVWVLITGAIVVLPQQYGRRASFLVGAGVLGVLLLFSLIAPLFERKPGEVAAP